MRCKAYGKVLVFGGYAILEEGNVGLVVNVDKGVSCTVQEGEGIRVEIPQYGITSKGTMTEGRLELDTGDVRLSFLVNAISLSLQFLESQGKPMKGMRIMTENDEAMGVEEKTGLGSSAAATVSIVAAVLGFHGVDDRDMVYKISCYSHHLTQDRMGSGYDVFAACYGSHFFTGQRLNLDERFLRCMASEWNISRERFSWPSRFLPLLVFTGKSASTKRMVEQVLSFRKNHGKEYEGFMQEYDAVNRELQKEFIEGKEVIDLLERSWAKRKELGKLSGARIESEEMTSLLAEMKGNGAVAAGLVGAGGGDSILALCGSEEERKRLAGFCEAKGLQVLDVDFNDTGYVLDQSS